MRAAGRVDCVASTDAVLPDRTHEAPRRGWPAQLAQWALVLGALGLLIGGVKWWDRYRDAQPTARVQSTVQAETAATAASTSPSADSLRAGISAKSSHRVRSRLQAT
jgi:hypothetical protein